MKEPRRDKIFSIIIFALIALGSLSFVTWIGQMSFNNTCVELQEQYIGREVGEILNQVENSINFGKELDNYYGMDEVLESICQISEGNLKVVVTDASGDPMYLSFDESAENVQILADIYGQEYRETLLSVAESTVQGVKASVGSRESLIFPIFKNDTELLGHVSVIYQQEALQDNEGQSNIWKAMFIVWAVITVLIILIHLIRTGDDKKKLQVYLPVFAVMIGMFVFILYLYNTYQEKYNVMIQDNVVSAATFVQDFVERLIDKGLPIDDTYRVAEYLTDKVRANDAIGSISVVRTYFDTATRLENVDSTVIHLPLSNDSAYIDVAVSQSFIQKQIRTMTLTFGAIFIICLMITYELTHLVEIISARLSNEFGQETDGQIHGLAAQIKLYSFIAYTALYTSMPYAAVLMREWDASVFGLSKSVSASLPLTVELLCVMICSMILQKVYADTRMDRLAFFVFPFLIIGNLACMVVSSPYMLIGLRAFCGVGFAFLKYWLNSYVAAGSRDSREVSHNYGQLNAGLLGGITVGASLGSILAQSFGYQFNYLFTAIICLAVMVLTVMFMPFKMLNRRRLAAVEKAKEAPVRFGALIRNGSVLKAILLGDIPLNIGLMYVVSFLPVYMSSVGQSGVATSYAYLINGLAGVYVGVFLLSFFKNLSPKMGSVLALGLGSAGILILVAGSHVGILLLSAGIMGLFDGYGTPTVTGFFTSLSAVKKADTASMLTMFNSVGSAVQIVCPMLYNILIQPDGQKSYLMIFGICFAAVTVLFFLLFRAREIEEV